MPCSSCENALAEKVVSNDEILLKNGTVSGKKKNRRKNKNNGITYLKEDKKAEEARDIPEISEPEKTPSEPIILPAETDNPEKFSEPLNEPLIIPQPEIPKPEPESVPEPQPKTDTVTAEEAKEEIPNPKRNLGGETIEFVTSDAKLPKADNKSVLPSSSGIMYEIAEELYISEKTRSQLEALYGPPFRKIFSEQQIEKLDFQAEENTRRLISSTAENREPTFTADGDISEENRSMTTLTAFLVQLLLLVPGLNIAAAVVLAFSKSTNINIKSYTRAFIIWCSLFMTIVLAYLTVYYFSTPNVESRLSWIGQIFH